MTSFTKTTIPSVSFTRLKVRSICVGSLGASEAVRLLGILQGTLHPKRVNSVDMGGKIEDIPDFHCQRYPS